MARFIVDIANVDVDVIPDVMDMITEVAAYNNNTQGIVTVYCIDETNENQFNVQLDNGKTNELTEKQIQRFKEVCDE